MDDLKLADAALLMFALLLVQMPSAKTIVSSEACGITFTVHIALVGNGSSEAFAQRVRDGISNYWDRGFTCKACKCPVTVASDVIVVGGNDCSAVPPLYNCVRVTETAAWMRSYVYTNPWENGEMESSDGEWDSLDTENVIAHEVGHYLGNGDEYEDNYEYIVRDAGGNVVSGPNYVKKSDWGWGWFKRREIERTAPPGGSVEFTRDADGNLEPFSLPKDGEEIDSLMANSNDPASVVKQKHIDLMCTDSGASCGVSCCCGNNVFDSAAGEACEPSATPTGCRNNYVCTDKCSCQRPLPVCGDGKAEKDLHEECDPAATPSGCRSGFACTLDCKCAIELIDGGDDVASNKSNNSSNGTISVPRCGNGITETGEQCDGSTAACGNPNARCNSQCACEQTQILPCSESWQCGGWGECAGGTQSRTCTDSNNCNTTASRPEMSRSCQIACLESWSCGEWGAWGGWSACPEGGTQTRSRSRTCTDANSCGTTNSRPALLESESQGCTYTPTEQKPEYSAHESALGDRISNLPAGGASESKDLSAFGGEWGYRILNIPTHSTITVCVSASGPLGFVYYPQYHYGFDFTDTTPGCTQIYNKNAWANGVLVHLGDPGPASVTAMVTVTGS